MRMFFDTICKLFERKHESQRPDTPSTSIRGGFPVPTEIKRTFSQDLSIYGERMALHERQRNVGIPEFFILGYGGDNFPQGLKWSENMRIKIIHQGGGG